MRPTTYNDGCTCKSSGTKYVTHQKKLCFGNINVIVKSRTALVYCQVLCVLCLLFSYKETVTTPFYRSWLFVRMIILQLLSTVLSSGLFNILYYYKYHQVNRKYTKCLSGYVDVDKKTNHYALQFFFFSGIELTSCKWETERTGHDKR